MDAYAEAMVRGRLDEALQIRVDNPRSGLLLSKAAATRHLDIEYDAPKREYVTPAQAAGSDE